MTWRAIFARPCVEGPGTPRRRLAMSSRDPNRPPANPDDPRYVEELEAEVAELRDLRVLLLEAYDQLEHVSPGII